MLARWLRPAPAAASALLDELLALAGEGGAGAGSHASSDERGGVFDAVHGRFEHQDGALRAAGFVAASGAIGDSLIGFAAATAVFAGLAALVSARSMPRSRP